LYNGLPETLSWFLILPTPTVELMKPVGDAISDEGDGLTFC
jgi:hypothetical protein